jgi:hypothetical protein
MIYCVEDKSVKTVGSSSEAGQMSPRNLLTTTIGDELRLATNFRSKVIGIALKDRGSILPAGHSANGAYWYDSQNGNWITSSYYTNELPKWVIDFNAKKWVDKYYEQNWNTLYPVNTYVQSNGAHQTNQNKAGGTKGFPYSLKQFQSKNYGLIASTPFGNTLTVEFAKAALTNENLGRGNSTDFLTISFSSTDYVGHAFGPNSVEAEDVFLRLDKDLGDLFDFIDSKVGKNQYLLFLSADHGAAHVPDFLKEQKIPSGNLNMNLLDTHNNLLSKKYGKDKLLTNLENYQLYLNQSLIASSNLNEKEIKEYVIETVTKIQGVDRAFDVKEMKQVPLTTKVQNMLINGYYPNRCGDIQLILTSQWIEGFAGGGTTHGLWNPYDAHIPLLWYGWGIKPGKLNRETSITDIAPTLAALLHIQMPSGNVGNVIEEVRK